MSKKLKVLHVVPTLKKDGAEVQLVELFKEIDNQKSKEFEQLLNSQLSRAKIEEGKIIEGKINQNN